ncbi:MAG: tyrosine-type recombinase/integrase [Lachnospiraceae bacterium]|nr:tyrosine-type recombinase/integrase [Lachnospiraceae bacterium]
MLKLPHILAHNLRNTGCTRMAEAGIDPKVLQYIMGHSKISVTMEIYNHVSKERNRKEMDKLEKIRI